MNTGSSITDLAYLFELSGGDKTFVREMVRIFLNENPAELEMLEKGIHSKDFPLIHHAAHKLRSTLPFVGIHRIIEEEINEIETLSAADATTPVDIPGSPPEGNILASINTALQKIGSLFPRVKQVCEIAQHELAEYK